MQYTVHNFNGHVILKVVGDIDTYNLSEFKKAAFEVLEEKNKSVLLDMEEVGFADSSAISALVACKRLAMKNDGDFGLINVSENFVNILRLATLHSFFKMYKGYESLPVVDNPDS
ncbi:MAG: STAS domain-containing protein [Spirochaetota bacterium]